jgi:hypothetical protein
LNGPLKWSKLERSMSRMADLSDSDRSGAR